MKHVIMFKGGVETLEFFSVEISRYLPEDEYDVFWYDLFMSESSFVHLLEIYNTHKDEEFVVLTFNFEGLEGETGLYQKLNWNFWDYSGIKVVNIVVDHPLYYHKYLATRPQNYVQIDIDKVHMEYMNRFYPDVKTLFMASAGTEVNKDRKAYEKGVYIPVKDRPMDIIFTGNYTPKHILRKQIDNLEQDYIDFYEKVLSDIINHPDMTIDEAVEKHLREEFIDLTDEQLCNCMPGMMYADLNVRFHYRELAIRALVDSGLKVNTYGEGYNYIVCEHPENIIQHGSANSQQCLDNISQAKISLNVMPWFKKGAHDRVFNSCLNGAVCLTDSSSYLDEIFTDGKDILFYDLNMLKDYEMSGYDYKVIEPMIKRVRELLMDDTALQSIADNAYELCRMEHTWENVTYSLMNQGIL